MNKQEATQVGHQVINSREPERVHVCGAECKVQRALEYVWDKAVDTAVSAIESRVCRDNCMHTECVIRRKDVRCVVDLKKAQDS